MEQRWPARSGNLADSFTHMGADQAAGNLAAAMRLGTIIKHQLGDVFVAAIGNGAA